MANLFSAVNNAVATIHNCDEEPIHIPGSIQPHGLLFVIDKKDGIIRLCSGNTETYFKQPPSYFLSKPYNEVLHPELASITGEEMQSAKGESQRIPTPAVIDGVLFDCFKRYSDTFFFLECMPSPDKPYNVYELFSHTNGLLQSTGRDTSLASLCDEVAKKIRDIIEYDRVMVYRFDEQYNGHVFAESVTEGMETFYDLHYPHTDIPRQARELYLKNLMRLIPDVNYTPVPIVTLDAELARPEMVDLSNVHLRSVSPIHIRYLQNMGVGATFTISLIKDSRLWGLIACHHYKAKNLSYNKQVQAYLLSQILASQIDVQETAEKYALLQQLDVPLKNAVRHLEGARNFIEEHFQDLAIIPAIANAAGVALIYQQKVYTNGLVPPKDFIHRLEQWLAAEQHSGYNTAELSAVFPGADQHTDTASGVLYEQVNAGDKTALLWFRPSADKVVKWAGNPNKPAGESPLTPRNSFAEWKELKKGISEPWQQPEVQTAERFAYLFQQRIFQFLQKEEELRFRKLNEQLMRANKELENINWISTHDLKEPLRKIQVFASMIDPSEEMNLDTVKLSIDRIRASASRMQTFIDDLLLYSKMSNSDGGEERVDLNDVVHTVLKEFAEEKSQGVFELTSAKLPVIPASRFQMQQLFVNLIGNAIKFSKENEKQVLELGYEKVREESAEQVTNWHVITVKDTGVGFAQKLSESIFDIFKRGHSDTRFKGTGVGLSICRKIMENHHGRIVASGEEGKGASFKLYFPAEN